MAPLIENKKVRQRPEEGFRRWLLNDFFDVILWYEQEGGSMTGFQVCYSKNDNEKVFTYQEGKSSSHYLSDGLGIRKDSYAAKTLEGDAGPVPELVINRIKAEAGELDIPLLNQILNAIYRYNKKRAVIPSA